jgi:hypothetical protein
LEKVNTGRKKRREGNLGGKRKEEEREKKKKKKKKKECRPWSRPRQGSGIRMQVLNPVIASAATRPIDKGMVDIRPTALLEPGCRIR